MIQRIQTIYLILSLVSTGLLLYLPIWVSSGSASIPTYPYATGYISAYASPLLLLVWGAAMLLQLVDIFLFKNRKLQIRIGQAAILLNILFLIAAVFLITQQKVTTSSLHGFRSGIILPLISIVLLILANRGIHKDEELIRSTNRLR